MSAEPNEERGRLKRAWPQEFRDGERCAYFGKFEGERETGGYSEGLPQPGPSTDRHNRLVLRLRLRPSVEAPARPRGVGCRRWMSGCSSLTDDDRAAFESLSQAPQAGRLIDAAY